MPLHVWAQDFMALLELTQKQQCVFGKHILDQDYCVALKV